MGGVLLLSAVMLVGGVYIALIFPILAIVDCIQNPRLTNQSKAIWAVVIFFTAFIGAAIYAFACTNRPLLQYSAMLGLFAIVAGVMLKLFVVKPAPRVASAPRLMAAFAARPA